MNNIKNLKDLRYAMGKSQITMAKDLEISQANISQIENNDRLGEIEFYIKLYEKYSLNKEVVFDIMYNNWLYCTKFK